MVGGPGGIKVTYRIWPRLEWAVFGHFCGLDNVFLFPAFNQDCGPVLVLFYSVVVTRWPDVVLGVGELGGRGSTEDVVAWLWKPG